MGFKQVLLRLLCLLMAAALPLTAASQADPNYPSRAVRLIVPFPPSGSHHRVLLRVRWSGHRRPVAVHLDRFGHRRVLNHEDPTEQGSFGF